MTTKIPNTTVEVAFDGGPFSSSYTWTDITPWVEGFSVSRGRSYELDRIEAGTLTLDLDNSDGRFTPGKVANTANLLANAPGTKDLSGAANGTVITSIPMGQVDDDGLTRVIGMRLSTSGPSVSGYFAVKWLNSSGGTISFYIGTRFVADSYATVYTHLEAPPAGTVNATVYVYADTYPDGNTSLTVNYDQQSWQKAAPYYPNVLPRRRIRVRTSNLTPKDVSTGGDVSRSSALFSTSHAAGQSNSWTTYPKSGAGAVRVDFGNNGTTDYASGIRCGYASGGKPYGLAHVAAGQPYSIGTQIRLGASSPAVKVVQRIRWYDVNCNYLSTSASCAPATLQNGVYVPVTLTNQYAPTGAVWAGIEVGTSGGDGPNGYLMVDELQLQQGTTLDEWTPGGAIFHGYVEKWPMKPDDLMATSQLSAVDGFSVLGTTELRTPFEANILSTDPVGYWPLGDPVGATALANAANDQQPAKLVASKYGGATPLLGATSIVAKDQDTTSYSLANVSANTGTVVDICDGGNRNYPLGTDFAVAFWTTAVRPSAGSYVTLFAGWSDTGAQFMTIRMDSTGKVTLSATFTDGTTQVINSSAVASSSVANFVVANITSGHAQLFLNNVANLDTGPTPTSTDIRDLRWASFAGQQGQSVYTEYANGRHGHLAIWNRNLTSAEMTDMWNLGQGADYTEGEAARLARIANMGDYAGEQALDGSMSTLQGPSWSSGTTALEALQSAAEAANGYVFMDGDGRLTYHNRQRRQSAIVRFTLDDTLGTPFEPGLEFTMDEDRLINEVTYQRTGGISGVLRDADSIATYGRKTKSLDLPITSDSEVQDASYTLLNIYADPIVRCDQVTLMATATPGLFGIALGIEIGDRITLSNLPASAPASSMDFYVEAVNTQVTADGTNNWVTTLNLSPASQSDIWLLEDPILGRLDRTAVLAY